MYGDADRMVNWRDVEAHAAEARGRGGEMGQEVRMERFGGSGHVGHVRKDGERYWGIVGEMWKER